MGSAAGVQGGAQPHILVVIQAPSPGCKVTCKAYGEETSVGQMPAHRCGGDDKQTSRAEAAVGYNRCGVASSCEQAAKHSPRACSSHSFNGVFGAGGTGRGKEGAGRLHVLCSGLQSLLT